MIRAELFSKTTIWKVCYGAHLPTVVSILTDFLLSIQFQTIAVERRRLIQEELEIALNQLKRRFGKEIARLTKGSTINLTVAEFLDEHGGNLNEAVKAMNDKKMESKEEDNNNEIERTIRKR